MIVARPRRTRTEKPSWFKHTSELASAALRIRASRFCSNTIIQETRPSSQFESSHPSIHCIPSIHTSIHPFIQPPIHPSIHASTTILVTLAGPAQTSSEEMRARGRDEQEESVRAAASQRGPSCTRPCPTCGHTGSDPSACLCRQCMRPCCSSVCEARHLAGLAGYVPCRGPLN